MREVLPCSVIPMLLGNNRCSRRLARRLFWRLNLRSVIFDTFSSGELDLMISAAFSPIPMTSNDEFILLGLEKFAAENDDMTCLLVPCSDWFVEFTDRYRQRLDERFIIRLPAEVERATRVGSKMPYARKGIS
jgi:hypothetical protein